MSNQVFKPKLYNASGMLDDDNGHDEDAEYQIDEDVPDSIIYIDRNEYGHLCFSAYNILGHDEKGIEDRINAILGTTVVCYVEPVDECLYSDDED